MQFSVKFAMPVGAGGFFYNADIILR